MSPTLNTIKLTLSNKSREEGRVPQLGSIVNCASINSTQAHVGSIAYIASKHTVVGITKVVSDIELRSSLPVYRNLHYPSATNTEIYIERQH
jgi:NAD(P)-dependent dehydrogenase (short-subunit alcohol dehydrogenase family)